MPIRIRFIPALSAFCAGGFLTALLVATILISVANAINAKSISSYGHALASLAAKQAVDAAFNHDLVRLQVILQDVVQNPHAVLATIHDVENKLLVQAGDAHRGRLPAQVFSAPITLHDSMAGYVSVTVNEQPWSLGSAAALVAAIACLMAALAIWSLVREDAVQWRSHRDRSTPDASPARSGSNAVGDDEDRSDANITYLPEHDPACVYAVIHIKNLNVLYQQLNGASFRDTIERLEHIISDVMALYGGHGFELVDNYYVLSFATHSDRGEALFNASCGAYLILELAGILDKIPLDLAALVSANHDDIVPEKLPFAGLILEATAGAEELINRRIEFMELGTDDGRLVIASFRQPFSALLENQRKQLAQIL